MTTKQLTGRWSTDQSCYVVLTDGGGNLINLGTSNLTYLNIQGAGTHVVKSGSGYLHRVIVNRAILSSVVTVYDNTAASGTKIATVTNPLALLSSQMVLPYECNFNTGLTVVTSAGDDITVVYS